MTDAAARARSGPFAERGEVGGAPQADADEERLLEDQDQDPRDDVARVPLGRVEERPRDERERVAKREGLRLRHPLRLEALHLDAGRERCGRLGEARERLAVDEEVRRVGEDADRGGRAPLHVALESRGDREDASGLAPEDEPLGLGQACGAGADPDELVRVGHPRELAGERRLVEVDDGDRDLLEDLAPVGCRVEEGVERDGADEDEERAGVAERPADLVAERPEDGPHVRPQYDGSRITRPIRQSARGGARRTNAASAASGARDVDGGAPRIA